MRALSLLPAMLLVAACAGSPTPSGTPASTEAPSTAAAASAAPTLAPSPSAATTLENPRGSAINGPIYFGDAGDVFSLDPATGVRTLIVGGPTNDDAPGLSPDGTKLVTFRADDGWLYISSPDGSGLKRWAKGSEISQWTWSPDGSRLAAITDGRTARDDLIIWDGGAGPKAHLDVDSPANYPLCVDNDTLLLVEEKHPLVVNFWTVNADGTGLKPVAALHPCCWGSIHHETGGLAYSNTSAGARTSSPAVATPPRRAPRKRSSSPCSGGGDGIGLVARPPSGPTGKPPSRPASPTTGSNDRAATVRPPGARRWRLTAAATADRAPSPWHPQHHWGARKGRALTRREGTRVDATA